MMIPFTFTLMQGKTCLIESDYFAADVDMTGPNEWVIEAYYIDVTSPEKRLRGETVYDLIEDEYLIKLLSVHQEKYSDQIASGIDARQSECGFKIIEHDEHRLSHADLLGRRAG